MHCFKEHKWNLLQFSELIQYQEHFHPKFKAKPRPRPRTWNPRPRPRTCLPVFKVPRGHWHGLSDRTL